MDALTPLNFPLYSFRVRSNPDSSRQIWDDLRHVWLVLTPEEWVRQHLVRHLIAEMGALPLYIVQEYRITLGGTTQRADVVVCDREGHPQLLAECKAPEVALSEEVLAQAVRYNSVVNARWIIITNGKRHIALQRDPLSGRWQPMDRFPDLSHLYRIDQL